MDTASPAAMPAHAQIAGAKSGTAPGQMAKLAVAEARAAGVDLPKNAQGFAASAIARGADPASVFAAQAVTDPEPADGTVPLPDGNEAPPADTTGADAAAASGYAEAADALADDPSATVTGTMSDMAADAAADPAETALALLEAGEEQTGVA